VGEVGAPRISESNRPVAGTHGAGEMVRVKISAGTVGPGYHSIRYTPEPGRAITCYHSSPGMDKYAAVIVEQRWC
jgi:hypothetical protein